MKTDRNRRFLTGTAALLLSFGLVLTSCPSPVENGGGQDVNDISVTIEGEPQVGQTLTATVTGGSGAPDILWQWTDDANEEEGWTTIRDAKGEEYTLTSAEVGFYVRAYISGTSVYSNFVGPVEAVRVVSVTIEGEPRVGETLTATVTGESGDPDIRWQRMDDVNEGSWTIKNAKGNEYTLTPAEEGFYVRAYILIGSGDTAEYVYSDFVGPVAADNDDVPGDGDDPGDGSDPDGPPLTGSVIVKGTGLVGQTLTANVDKLNGNGAITYQWQRSNTPSEGFKNITGATSDTYTLVLADAGKYVRVKVSRAENSGIRVGDKGLVVLPTLADSVTISGTPYVGRALTVKTGTLGGSAATAYQWQISDAANGGFADITGATSTIYSLIPADAGKYIRVKVSNVEYEGTITSKAVGPVEFLPLSGSVTISGTPPYVGRALTANVGDLGDSAATAYQWQISDAADGGFTDITGATSTIYSLIPADAGKYIRMKVSNAEYKDTITSKAVGPVEFLPLSGSVTISGTPRVGKTLTANADTPGDSAATAYQWQISDAADGGFTDITGATSTAYTLLQTDAGKYIRMKVSHAEYKDTITSEAAGPVALRPLVGSVTITTISNPSRVGQTLTANADTSGDSAATAYQWQISDAANGGFTDITGATSDTYTLVRADAGKYIRVGVSNAEYEGTITCEAVGPVALPILTGSVTINGIFHVERVLTAETGTLGDSAATAYQWQRSNTSSGGFTDITGATSVNYILTQADAGKYIRVGVSNAEYEGTITCKALGPLEYPALVGTVTITTISNPPCVGQTLTVNTDDLDGSEEIFYQWQRSDAQNSGFKNISNAASFRYTLAPEDAGKYIQVRVSRRGYDGVTIGGPVRAVALPPLTGSVTVSGTLRVRQSLTANVDNLDGNGTITYKWQRSDAQNSGFKDITGAASFRYTLAPEDLNKYIRVEVSRAGYEGVMIGGPVGQVSPEALLPLTWTIVKPTEFNGFNASPRAIYSAGYGGGIFLVGEENFGHIAYSEDGADWTVAVKEGNSHTRRIVYGNNRFVAGGENSASPFVVYSTDNGRTWREGNVNGILRRDSDSIRGMAYGNGTFVAVGGSPWYHIEKAKAMYSKDGGVNWTPTDLGVGSDAINRAVAWGGGTFVAIGGNGRAAYSSDGVNWTATPSPVLKDPGRGEIGIAYDERQGRFVAVADNGSAAYSDDRGKTWTAVNDNNLKLIGAFSDIEWGGGYFLAGGYNSSGTGRLVYSADGITWHVTGNNIPETMITHALKDPDHDNEQRITTTLEVVYGNGKFLVTGVGAVMYSNAVE